MAKYMVQMVRFNEFERNELDVSSIRAQDLFESESFEEARAYFNDYCSGLNDEYGPCDNQNRSVARFYRIIETED